jgi:hypothetical protein
VHSRSRRQPQVVWSQAYAQMPGSHAHGFNGPCTALWHTVDMLISIQSHGNTIKEKVEILKPGAKLCGQAIGRFLSNPTLASSSNVFLYIALTTLDKSNGMFSFVSPGQAPDTESDFQEEEVTLSPGDGLLWRGDCARRSGGGYGAIVLILQYD